MDSELAEVRTEMIKKCVFVRFDFNSDSAAKGFIIGQAKNSDSPFE